MNPLLTRIGLSVIGLALVTHAQAATTITGTIASTLTLTTSCLVNGNAGSSALNFGALNFGSTTTLFTEVGAQVGGSGALSIQCSAGTNPVVKVRAGSHDGQSAGGNRALVDGTGNNFVPYDLYTDSGHNTILPIDGTVALTASTGAAQTVNLYGRAVGKVGLPAGTYTDTIAVELTF